MELGKKRVLFPYFSFLFNFLPFFSLSFSLFFFSFSLLVAAVRKHGGLLGVGAGAGGSETAEGHSLPGQQCEPAVGLGDKIGIFIPIHTI
jgi:hypothetical protein